MSLDRDDKVDLTGAREVTIAGKTYPVPPLTLRQIKAVGRFLPNLAAAAADKADSEKTLALIDTYAEILVIGLKIAHPKATVDDILDMRMSPAEVSTAATIVIEQGGGKMVPAGEPTAASAKA